MKPPPYCGDSKVHTIPVYDRGALSVYKSTWADVIIGLVLGDTVTK